MIEEVVEQRTDAALARQRTVRPLQERRPAERHDKAHDRQVGRQRRTRGRSQGSARAAAVRRRLDDSRAGPGALHERRAVRRAGHWRGRLPDVRRRSGLERGQVDHGHRAAAGQSGGRASHPDVRAAARRQHEQRPGQRQRLSRGLCSGPASRAADHGPGPLRAGRLEADLPDALHAQRLAAKGPQLLRLRVCRSQDGEEGSARDQRRERRVSDSAGRRRLPGQRAVHLYATTRCC